MSPPRLIPGAGALLDWKVSSDEGWGEVRNEAGDQCICFQHVEQFRPPSGLARTSPSRCTWTSWSTTSMLENRQCSNSVRPGLNTNRAPRSGFSSIPPVIRSVCACRGRRTSLKAWPSSRFAALRAEPTRRSVLADCRLLSVVLCECSGRRQANGVRGVTLMADGVVSFGQSAAGRRCRSPRAAEARSRLCCRVATRRACARLRRGMSRSSPPVPAA